VTRDGKQTENDNRAGHLRLTRDVGHDDTMKLMIAIAVSLLLNIVVTFVGQGRFVFDVFIFAACIWIAAPLFLFSGIFLAVAYRKPHPASISFGQWVMLASLVIGSCFASIYFGGLLNNRQINEAKSYCEQLAIQLDKVRETSGLYPTNLTEYVQQSNLPRILRGGNLYYHSQGTNYSITFSDPGGLMNGWDFIGNTKKWSQFD